MMHLGNELLKDKRVVKLAAKDVVYGTSNLRSVFDYVQDNISSGKTVTRLVDEWEMLTTRGVSKMNLADFDVVVKSPEDKPMVMIYVNDEGRTTVDLAIGKLTEKVCADLAALFGNASGKLSNMAADLDRQERRLA